ncbi:MAG: ABC transporter ATP-binding protein [Candidatus Bathyarchaeia archaeon]
MRGITKRFPGVLANDHVDFDVKTGEVHALLGENGAGKTTLMNILYGLHQPDEGEIFIRGERVTLSSPKDAIDLGIGMVHQHFMLIPTLTVAENIVLGKPSKSLFLNIREVEKHIAQLSDNFRLKIDPKAKISQLSVGERQRVEIIKALCRGAEILILDEPTSMLTPPEIREITAIVRRLAKQGLAVIPFITHKLPEVMAVSDRVTILKQGKVISTVETARTDQGDLAKKMVGRATVFRVLKREAREGKTVLEVDGLCALDDGGFLAVKGVSFSIREGETLGIAGVAGNGQRELEEALMGLRRTTAGKVRIDGEDVTNSPPEIIIAKRIGYIPGDRVERGVVSDASIVDNLILKVCSESPYAYRWFFPFERRWFLNKRDIDRHAEDLTREYDIKTPSKDIPAGSLSGGNLQRLILARELSRNPRILVAVQPTRGLDVGATEFIRNKLMEQKDKGAAILLISEDLDEITSTCDRVAVMYEGQIVGTVDAAEARVEEIGLMMAGAKRIPSS